MKIARPIRWLVLLTVLIAICGAASAGVFISVNFGPPALPIYEQPPCPDEGYIWTPGYWAYGPYGYYWVPGTWVLAPQPGYLWTPGYWGYGEGLYYWHPGYWGPVVGFYGGIPYGYGYTGEGYHGGYWRDNHFYYNQTVNNVNVTRVTNVYNTTIINNNTTTVNRVSYNGGPGGITARPTAAEEAAARERHIEPTQAQTQHETLAKNNPQLRASVNNGRPPIAATAKPAAFKGNGVVAATRAGEPYKAPVNRPVTNNNVPRPGNNVPRPPNASLNGNAPHPANPHPEVESRGVPNESHNVPRPPSTYQPGNGPHTNQPMIQNAPREGSVGTQNAPRPAYGNQNQGPRPEYTPHNQVQAPRVNEARPPEAAKPESTPHPQSETRPEEPRHEPPK
ncbi:MAG: YXWGXW repeat-containing protein [Acidobacteriaceae bacterium]|nr:YXWGXW repeat-containing protein [Acidobacteriaceae bacterium]